jgi:hypothetical protein
MLGIGPFTLSEMAKVRGGKNGIQPVVSKLRKYDIHDMIYRTVMVPLPGDPTTAIKIMVMLHAAKPLALSDPVREDWIASRSARPIASSGY